MSAVLDLRQSNQDHADYKTRVLHDFGTARVVATGISPFDGDDLVVQKRDGDAWVQVLRFNSLSNDYAYTSARDEARAIAAKGVTP